MLLQLLRFEVLYQSKQRALLIFVLLFFIYGFFLGGLGQAPAQVNFNSAYQIANYTTISTLGCVFIIMFFAISGVIRDKKHQMESLIFSTSISKIHFFWSRFIGVFLFSVLAFCLFLPGFIIGLSISDLDVTRLSPFQLQTYVWPFLVIIIPNFFICSALIFSVSILSKSNLATYASAVLIYILYFLVAFYSNSPIMASSVPASVESLTISALVDPFAGATFFEYTHFWTPYEKNNMMFSFTGTYFWNRLIWIGLSFIVLGFTYWSFSFRKQTQRIKRKQLEPSYEAVIKPYFSVLTQYNTKSQWLAFKSSLDVDIKGIFKSLPFLVVVGTLLIASILEIYARIFEGGSYGDSWYPFTNLLLEIVMELVPILSLILIVFYSGELIWKARDKKIDSILNTTPTQNWVFFLSKLVALALVPLVLIATVTLVCIGFQLINGYANFEIKQYLSVFYYYGTPMVVYAMIAIFIQSIVNSKFLGMGITGFVFLFLGSSLASNIGIEHPMLRVGNMPIPLYSNMSGYSIHASAFNTYAIFWTAFGVVLSFLSFKLWKRRVKGTEHFLESLSIKKWKRWEIVGLLSSIVLFLVFGTLLFIELNIKNSYMNSNDFMDHAEQYERKFKVYDTIPRLHYIDLKTKVDIYPSEQKYSVDADYILINKNEIPVTHIFITERKVLSEISVDNTELIFKDSVFGTYLFKFFKPILPQKTVRLRYNFTKQSSPYNVDRTIVKNGSYIRHDGFEPALGYRSSMEISNPHERQKRELPKQDAKFEGDEHLFSREASLGNVSYQTIVSTEEDQKALAVGNLLKEWKDNNRNYYHYKLPDKNIPALAYFSGNYSSKNNIYKDVSLEYYYHPDHDMNHKAIDASTKATLDYCIDNFGNYPFDHLRIAEIPSYHSFGGAAHPGLINMVEDNLYLIDIRNTGTFNLVAKRTVHEVAHQWWGMILKAKNVEGGGFIVEGFTKYIEGVVLEKMYGKGTLWELNKASNDRYFGGRTFASTKEPPVYLTDSENYLNYGKSSLVMLSLRDLIGEDKLNQVLRILTERYAQSQEFEVHTLEFIEELYKVTPEIYHDLVDDWMKKIVRYDLSIGDSSSEKLGDGTYEITLEVKAKRFVTMENGEEEAIGINEPIKIGLFSKHPKHLGKNDLPIYLQSHLIDKESNILKIRVEELPKLMSIDPFLTRVDRMYSDNLKEL
ncbi:M1 family aminopeptidase [uncultured Psychroserpens sp.]|uniref:ABC transporter permease/M1 family aminopeptidase n=1 Tax=uncultured Psychroserpens sp. TaxID=255436 RepID=UPI0026039C5A|nr:M1 family aminopeptidase [uncultured Psychroserpens sp.]